MFAMESAATTSTAASTYGQPSPSPSPSPAADNAPRITGKFRHALHPQQAASAPFRNETHLSVLENLLECEQQHNKTEAWNKLDQPSRLQKLHAFAEKYGRETSLPQKEIKNLKVFLSQSLAKGKLNRAKDVVYDREAREVKSVPALHFNGDTKAFTLRLLDDKRPSTLKSLTPRRMTPATSGQTATAAAATAVGESVEVPAAALLSSMHSI
jgi:hypothetical protein